MSDSIVPTRVGLLGWPVAHSRSPAMQQAAFQALELPWEYLLLPVPPPQLPEAVRGLRGLGFAGANVTVPHKQAIMPHLDEVTLEARTIGAVNTIVLREGRLVGYNTDALGFLRALREVEVDPRGCRVLLLGAGGAGRAVLYALMAAHAQVTLVNRTMARAQALAQHFQALFKRPIALVPLVQRAALQRAVEEADLIVNSTSLGMAPHEGTSPLPADLFLPPGTTVYDLVYTPRPTLLLRRAQTMGARPVDGLGMLLHQGAAAFTLWTGQPAPLEAMRDALNETV